MKLLREPSEPRGRTVKKREVGLGDWKTRLGLGCSQLALRVLWEGKPGKEDCLKLSHHDDALPGPGAVPVRADLG